MPFFMRDRYAFSCAEIIGKACVLFMARDGARRPAGSLRKDCERLQDALKRTPIWVSKQIDGHDRLMLIRNRVPFVIPRYQAYLPDLLIDAREYFPRAREPNPSARLSPSTQRLLLQAIYRGVPREFDQVIDTQPHHRYSPMTVSRAIDELVAADLVEAGPRGRTRQVRFTLSREDLWSKALPLLRSPIRRRVLLTDATPTTEAGPMPTSGLTALAEMSMLAAPARPSYATVHRVLGKQTETWHQFETPRVEDAESELELWAYAPLVERQPRGCVDRLSLYLALQHDEDVRTQSALKQILNETLHAEGN